NRSEAAQLSGSDQPISRFTISADGNTIAAAAAQQNSPGVVYLFAKGASWTSTTESQKISASDGAPNDGFGGTAVSGGAIALDTAGTTMIVGAPGATVGSNASQGLAYILGGNAGTPTASISPNALAFGNQVEGTSSSTQSVTVTNTGNASLSISGVAVSSQFTSTQ